MKEKTGRGMGRAVEDPGATRSHPYSGWGSPEGRRAAGSPEGRRAGLESQEMRGYKRIGKLLADTSMKPEDGWVVVVFSKMQCGLGGAGEQGLDMI